MSLSNDDIKQLISILQRGLSDDAQVEMEASQKPKAKRKNSSRSSIKSSEKTKENTRPNKFDAMPERRMHKEDSAIDSLLIKYPPTERSREFDYVEAACRVCGRKEKVNPVLIHDSIDRYKCNKCSSTQG